MKVTDKNLCAATSVRAQLRELEGILHDAERVIQRANDAMGLDIDLTTLDGLQSSVVENADKVKAAIHAYTQGEE